MISERAGTEKSHEPHSRVSTRLLASVRPRTPAPHSGPDRTLAPPQANAAPRLSLSPWPAPYFCPELLGYN